MPPILRVAADVVSYGAAIGHVTPEAATGGDILYLMTGDLLHIQLRGRRMDLIDRDAFHAGRVEPAKADLATEREALGAERLDIIRQRRRVVAPTNVMLDVSDAAHGVIPQAVAEFATDPYRFKG
ncbi:MAG: dihydroxy-acid dehydratase [Candidatus Poribacteria bacterium]